MNKFIRTLFVFIIILFSNNILAKNNWILDKKLSEIYFQLTLLPADDLIVGLVNLIAIYSLIIITHQ